MHKLHVNQQNLQRAWDVTQRSTSEDWNEWIRRFTVELLRESPSPALRSCSALAQVYPTLARELFHAAFVSCWFELLDQYQENLVRSLGTCFGVGPGDDRQCEVPPDPNNVITNSVPYIQIVY